MRAHPENWPWAVDKIPLVEAIARLMIGWAKQQPREEVAETFHTRWNRVVSAEEMAICWAGRFLHRRTLHYQSKR